MTTADPAKPSNLYISFVRFKFPDSLDGDSANFRLIIELRYINDSGMWITDRSVMPGLEDYWECDPNRSNDRRFVRNGDGSASINFLDTNRFNDWDRVALMVSAANLFMCRATVVDVDRQSALEKILSVLTGMLGATLSTAAELVPQKIVSAPLGTFADKLQAWLMATIAAPQDKTLAVLSMVFPGGNHTGSHILRDRNNDYGLEIDVSTNEALSGRFRQLMEEERVGREECVKNSAAYRRYEVL
jgi:hypothetical protein